MPSPLAHARAKTQGNAAKSSQAGKTGYFAARRKHRNLNRLRIDHRRLSIRKRNDKWQAQVRRTGHGPRTKTFVTRADAVRWVRQTDQELDAGGLAVDATSLERTTVADILRRYVRDVTPDKRGHASEAKRIEVFLRAEWAGLTLARATPQIFSMHRDKRLREVEAGTVIRELGLLRSVFEIARREWDLPLQEIPLANLRKPKAASGRNRRLRVDELRTLMTACTTSRTTWLRPCINIAIETGMRRGEILNIRRADLDLEKGLLSIPETKTDVPRIMPLSGEAIALLSHELLLRQEGEASGVTRVYRLYREEGLTVRYRAVASATAYPSTTPRRGSVDRCQPPFT